MSHRDERPETPERIYLHPTSAEYHLNKWPLKESEYIGYVRFDIAATRMRDRCVEKVKRKADGYQKDSERSDYLPNYRRNMALAASALREVANDLQSLTLEQGEQK